VGAPDRPFLIGPSRRHGFAIFYGWQNFERCKRRYARKPHRCVTKVNAYCINIEPSIRLCQSMYSIQQYVPGQALIANAGMCRVVVSKVAFNRIQFDSSAKETYRRPNPNKYSRGSLSLVSPMKRSGANTSGFAYVLASLNNCL